jgi:hypothetical protein
VPIGQEAGWAPEPVWTQFRGKILLLLPGIEHRSPGRPVRSQTLYWLSYPSSRFYVLPSWNENRNCFNKSVYIFDICDIRFYRSTDSYLSCELPCVTVYQTCPLKQLTLLSATLLFSCFLLSVEMFRFVCLRLEQTILMDSLWTTGRPFVTAGAQTWSIAVLSTKYLSSHWTGQARHSWGEYLFRITGRWCAVVWCPTQIPLQCHEYTFLILFLSPKFCYFHSSLMISEVDTILLHKLTVQRKLLLSSWIGFCV